MIIYSQRAGEGAEIVWLEHWSIRESADGARRFVGCNCATRRGCVSEKIFFSGQRYAYCAHIKRANLPAGWSKWL